jgi:hypothetical protein
MPGFLGFTFGVMHFMGFDKCTMTCTPMEDYTEQSHCPKNPLSSTYPSPLHPKSSNQLSFYCHHRFAFYPPLHIRNHTVHCINFFQLSYNSVLGCHLKIPPELFSHAENQFLGDAKPGARGMTQVIEYLPSKHQVLNSSPSTAKNNKKQIMILT